MMINKISSINVNSISFKNNTTNKDSEAQNAILMLKDPNASIKFQQKKEIAHNADAATSNPVKAIGYKLYKTFSLLKIDYSDIPQPDVSKELILLA